MAGYEETISRERRSDDPSEAQSAGVADQAPPPGPCGSSAGVPGAGVLLRTYSPPTSSRFTVIQTKVSHICGFKCVVLWKQS